MPVAKKGRSVEQILADWEKQPGARVTIAERAFIQDMREAFAAGVGYGWMKQVIDWEWDHHVMTLAAGRTTVDGEADAGK